MAMQVGAKAAQSIQRFWRTGQESRERKPLTTLRMPDFFAVEARKTGLNYDTVGKAQRVAHAFPEPTITRLCALVRKHNSRFAAAHLVILLRVRDKQDRLALAKEAIRENWNTIVLASVIKHRHGTRGKGGKRPFRPADSRQALMWLERECVKWRRWCDENRNSFSRRMIRRIDAAKAALSSVEELAKINLERSRAKQPN